ncbi:MAG: diaminopropionate ammonia-lyase [Acidobacteria bacterium]|jgi:diaminopropionate ammonia-lyase|nr:diaminopropionate ammonia-lyase [Acidobacteriota bacterium]
MIKDEFHICKYGFNSLVKEKPDWHGAGFEFLNNNDMLDFHKSLAGYAPTPLVPLPRRAEKLAIKELYVKDESSRFGIKAFKAIGASYAIYRFLKTRWEERFNTSFDEKIFNDPDKIKKLGSFTFCAATDGNHGRAVAWTANKIKQRAVIYMPENTAPARIENIHIENGEVVLVPGTFDDCVVKCAHDAEANGWQAISDTAYPGYTEIPKYIMLGYTTIFRELENTLNTPGKALIDFVFLPAGVGGLAAAGTAYYVLRYGPNRPRLICVEPSDCDCFLESVKYGNGNPLPTRGNQVTIMAGLNCGIPSPIAWPIIRDGMHLFTGITDNYAEEAMRIYHKEGVTAGESGASGLAGLMALLQDQELKDAGQKIGLDKNARVLLINTEGDTDPVNYKRILNSPSIY